MASNITQQINTVLTANTSNFTRNMGIAVNTMRSATIQTQNLNQNTQNLQNGFNNLGNSTQNLNTQLSSATGNMGNLINSLNKYSTIASVAFAGLFTAGIKSASSLQETMNMVNVAFKENTDVVVDWSKRGIEEFGKSQKTMLQAASLFKTLGDSMGLTDEKSKELALSLVELAADVDSFNEKYTFDEIVNKFRGFYTGETEGLKDLGVIITETALKEYMLKENISGTYKEMSEAEKIILRYSSGLESLAYAEGDFKRSLENGSLAVNLTYSKELLGQIMTEFGNNLLPVATDFMLKVNKMLSDFNKLSNEKKEGIFNVAKWTAVLTIVTSITTKIALLIGQFTALNSLGAFTSITNGFTTLTTSISAGTTAALTFFRTMTLGQGVLLGLQAALLGVGLASISGFLKTNEIVKESEDRIKNLNTTIDKIKNNSITEDELNSLKNSKQYQTAKEYNTQMIADAKKLIELKKQANEEENIFQKIRLGRDGAWATEDFLKKYNMTLEEFIKINQILITEEEEGINVIKEHTQARKENMAAYKTEQLEEFINNMEKSIDTYKNETKEIVELTDEYIYLRGVKNKTAEQTERLIEVEEVLINILNLNNNTLIDSEDGYRINIAALTNYKDSVDGTTESLQKMIRAQIAATKTDLEMAKYKLKQAESTKKMVEKGYFETYTVIPDGEKIKKGEKIETNTITDEEIKNQQEEVKKLEEALSTLNNYQLTLLDETTTKTSKAEMNKVNTKKKATKTQEEIMEESFNKERKLIDRSLELNDASTAEKLKKYEELYKKLNKNYEFAKDFEVELHNLRKQLNSELVDSQMTNLDFLKKYSFIDTEEYNNLLVDLLKSNKEFYNNNESAYREMMGKIQDSNNEIKNNITSTYKNNLKNVYDSNKEANKKLQNAEEERHKAQLKQIEEERDAKIKAIDDVIDKMEKDMEENDLNKSLQENLAIMEQTRNATSQEGIEAYKRAEEAVQKAQNSLYKNKLEEEKQNIKDKADTSLNLENLTYENTISLLEQQEEQLTNNYNLMLERGEEFINSQSALYNASLEDLSTFLTSAKGTLTETLESMKTGGIAISSSLMSVINAMQSPLLNIQNAGKGNLTPINNNNNIRNGDININLHIKNAEDLLDSNKIKEIGRNVMNEIIEESYSF